MVKKSILKKIITQSRLTLGLIMADIYRRKLKKDRLLAGLGINQDIR